MLQPSYPPERPDHEVAEAGLEVSLVPKLGNRRSLVSLLVREHDFVGLSRSSTSLSSAEGLVVSVALEPAGLYSELLLWTSSSVPDSDE